MCGIAGYVGRGSPDVAKQMALRLKHRGPDASGVWTSPDQRVGFAHTRLAIIDLSPLGAQPMVSEDGRYVITFNGEIYNFAALKKELAGYPFKSNSDTEVILAAYAAWGTDAFAKMRGMFALAIYDTHTHDLILARDRLGKKPLYWSFEKGLLLFGSELKVLLVHPECPRDIDHRSLSHYFARDYVPTPHTIYDKVHKLSPGSYLRLHDGVATIESFWKPCLNPSGLSEEAAKAELDSLLSTAVSERLVSDVPLGILLSGGIDSSTVAYYAAKASARPIETFSVGFDEASFDESSHARLVAAHLGTNHHETILSSADALALVGEIATVFDEPVADASILPTLLVARFARESVTVALGGDGADETLLGYPTFRAEEFAGWYAALPSAAQATARALASAIPPSTGYLNLGFKARAFTHHFDSDPAVRHLQWLGSFTESELPDLLSPDTAKSAASSTQELVDQWHSECPDLTGLNALSHLYLRTYLMDQVMVKVDRASMHYALEMRAPFLSHDLVAFLLSLPPELKYRHGRGKYLLRSLMRDRLPDAILDRKKQGFGIPVSAWLRSGLKVLATDVLAPNNVERSGLLQSATVTRLLEEHILGSRDHGKKLWTLLVFQLWYDRWHSA